MAEERPFIRGCRVPQQISKFLNSNYFGDSEQVEEFGSSYLYPVDFPLRKYQFLAVQKSIDKNILLCLPTGLGKTFVAAVMMLNFYRWFPSKKIFFVAPTRPLVDQQHQSCLEIGGFRACDTIIITGKIQNTKRVKLYKDHKVFFVTPQILQNDIEEELIDARDIICLVIDEAHKATGNHSFSQAVRMLSVRHQAVRILALTASPGTDLQVILYKQSIQNLVDTLLIDEILYFHEEHEDVRPYVYSKIVSEVILDFDGPIKEIIQHFTSKIDELLVKLYDSKAISNSAINSWSSYRFKILAMDTFKNRANLYSSEQYKTLSISMQICYFLLNCYERLCSYGFLSFSRYLLIQNASSWIQPFAINFMKNDSQFYNTLLEWHDHLENCAKTYSIPNFPYHPKILKLIQLLSDHFKIGIEMAGRAIVFSSFRDSVDEIVIALRAQSWFLKVMPFVGQANSKNTKGLAQKDQLEVLERFRAGKFNILVSTSVGEEGLDIGDVNLIVFFDISSSALRMIQRMGRTGRKKTGNIYIFLMKGSEQNSYKNAQRKSKQMTSTLTQKVANINFIKRTPLFGTEFKPICILTRFKVISNLNTDNVFSRKSKANLSVKTNKQETSRVNDMSLTIPAFNCSSINVLGIFGLFHSVKTHSLLNIYSRCPPLKSRRQITIEDAFCNQTSKNISFDNCISPSSNISSDFNDIIEVNRFCRGMDINSELQEGELTINDCQTVKEIDVSPSFENFCNNSTEKALNENSIINIKPLKRKKRNRGHKTPLTDSSSQECCKEKQNLGRNFLLTQAEAVDDDSEDTYLDSNENEYVQDSFINDDSINNSKHCYDTIYQQSIISPFKNQSDVPNRLAKWQKVVEGIETKIYNNLYQSSEFEKDEISYISEITSSNSSNTVNPKDDFASSSIISPACISSTPQNEVTYNVSLNAEEKRISFKFDSDCQMIDVGDENIVIWVDSKILSLNHFVINTLRQKYGFKLVNFTSLPFDYVLGRNSVIDCIYFKGTIIVKTDLKDKFVVDSLINKYKQLKYPYNVHLIVQSDCQESICSTIAEMIQSLIVVFLPYQMNIRYSNSNGTFYNEKETTATIIYEIAIDLQNKDMRLPAIDENNPDMCRLIKVVSQLVNLQILPIYLCLNLVQNFKSLKELLLVSEEQKYLTIEQKHIETLLSLFLQDLR